MAITGRPNTTLEYFPDIPWPQTPTSTSYGTCLRCIFDLEWGMSTGRQALAEALARRLYTDPGTLPPVGPDDVVSAGYGFNLVNLLNGTIRGGDLANVAAQVIGQFRQDDRVNDATCEPTYYGASNVLILNCTIFDRNGPFPLTLSVNDVTVTILSTQGSP